MTTVTPLPTPVPSRQDPINFPTRADAFLGALPTFGTELNLVAGAVSAAATTATTKAAEASASAASALNAPGTLATSTTNLSIGTGSKTLTIQTGKSLAMGVPLLIADSAAPHTNWMWGQITSYNSETGQLIASVSKSAGSGTLASWSVSLSPDPSSAVAGYPITTLVLTSSQTWIVPAGVSRIKVTVVGGGGGAAGDSYAQTGQAGGGGGAAIKTMAVTPGTGYDVTIGAGGSKGATGASGGTSSFVGTGATVSATGGAGGAGGIGSGGDLNIAGGSGGSSIANSSVPPALGGSSIFSGQAQGGGVDGRSYGGGGSGGWGGSGGNGASGVVVIEY